ncbi:hypothetical protein IB642_05895 [Allofrancisella guangzhouensis]|nr:hypothetical protein [Allofrancisella guangzhouensis]MBK2044551.1 hypothetical protein [Allofrancisella guangzhouensis]MBK2046117.1 hypothetical protein [Allofrancisella guangzhouensis]
MLAIKKSKKSIIFCLFTFILISCSNSQGDSLGYVSPPPTQRDMYSNEAGPLQQPGGVAAEIESEQGNPSDDSDLTIRY